jgi:hypothetical protein
VCAAWLTRLRDWPDAHGEEGARLVPKLTRARASQPGAAPGDRPLYRACSIRNVPAAGR